MTKAKQNSGKEFWYWLWKEMTLYIKLTYFNTIVTRLYRIHYHKNTYKINKIHTCTNTVILRRRKTNTDYKEDILESIYICKGIKERKHVGNTLFFWFLGGGWFFECFYSSIGA